MCLLNASFAQIVGIDPGKTGAIIIMNLNGEIVYSAAFDRTPGEVAGALKMIRGDRDHIRIYLEKVHAMPGQGVSSMFSFGEGYGFIQGYLAAIGVTPTLVSPQTWQKSIPRRETPKEAVRAWCESKFDLKAFVPSGCRVPHQGLMDAAGIAYFGLLAHRGLVDIPSLKPKKPRRRPITL